jgi:hypothetical protein
MEECSICFSECDKALALTCSHAFCKGCLLKWMQSPVQLEKPSCPMCRGPILFKGLSKIRYALEDKRWESAYDDTYAELFDMILEFVQRFTEVEKRAYAVYVGDDEPAHARDELFARLFSKRIGEMLGQFDRSFALMKDHGHEPWFVNETILQGVNYKREFRKEQKQHWRAREPIKMRAPKKF